MDYRQKCLGTWGKVKADLDAQLSQIPGMKTGQLRALWRELFDRPPHPKLRRELLIPIVAYRLQERALGGLKQATAHRLQAFTNTARVAKRSGPQPGTRMVRQWQGRVYEVVTVESGFMYDGQRFRSLSEIARMITGTRWSGPAFFGLKKPKKKEAA